MGIAGVLSLLAFVLDPALHNAYKSILLGYNEEDNKQIWLSV